MNLYDISFQFVEWMKKSHLDTGLYYTFISLIIVFELLFCALFFYVAIFDRNNVLFNTYFSRPMRFEHIIMSHFFNFRFDGPQAVEEQIENEFEEEAEAPSETESGYDSFVVPNHFRVLTAESELDIDEANYNFTTNADLELTESEESPSETESSDETFVVPKQFRVLSAESEAPSETESGDDTFVVPKQFRVLTPESEFDIDEATYNFTTNADLELAESEESPSETESGDETFVVPKQFRVLTPESEAPSETESGDDTLVPPKQFRVLTPEPEFDFNHAASNFFTNADLEPEYTPLPTLFTSTQPPTNKKNTQKQNMLKFEFLRDIFETDPKASEINPRRCSYGDKSIFQTVTVDNDQFPPTSSVKEI